MNKICFHCKKSKQLIEYRLNNGKYKRDSDMGVNIGCIECTEDVEKVKERILSKYSDSNKGWWKDEKN